MNEEMVVLVDEDNNELGTILKSEVHTDKTPLHRAFSVYIFNAKGEILIQQRAKSKITWGGIWSNSCCGHVSPGEEPIDAVRRRVKQELGIELSDLKVALPDFRYKVELDGIVENEICPVFIAKTNDEIKADSREIENYRWLDVDDYVACALKPGSIYSPWSIMQIKQLGKGDFFK